MLVHNLIRLSDDDLISLIYALINEAYKRGFDINVWGCWDFFNSIC